MHFSPLLKLKISMLVFTITFICAPVFSFAAPSTLVIGEFRIDGIGGEKDEYVVIANYGEASLDISQYALTLKTGNTTYAYLYRFLPGRMIQANEKIRICQNVVTGDSSCNLFYSGSAPPQMEEDGVLALVDLANKKLNVDVVGYGAAGCWESGCEKFPLDTPVRNALYRRINGKDTDASSQDFELLIPRIEIGLNVDKLVISELLPSPASGEEWFELYNPTNLNVSLANLKICDALGARHCYFFDKSDLLTGGSYKIYAQSVTKITLNNTGDWLELYDASDNLLADSGGNYGVADKGISLSLFGSEYKWTTTLTPNAQNVFTDTIEVEADVAIPKAKTSKSKVTTAAKKTVAASTIGANDTEMVQEAQAQVKAAETQKDPIATLKAVIGRKELGYLLIGLAILLVIGYIGWYFRDYAKNIYHKIRPRDDSTRF